MVQILQIIYYFNKNGEFIATDSNWSQNVVDIQVTSKYPIDPIYPENDTYRLQDKNNLQINLKKDNILKDYSTYSLPSMNEDIVELIYKILTKYKIGDEVLVENGSYYYILI